MKPSRAKFAVLPGGGYSHTLPIRVCAAHRGRDFEAPDEHKFIIYIAQNTLVYDLDGVSISEAFSRTGYKKLWITALSSP